MLPASSGHGPIDFVAYLGEGVGQLGAPPVSGSSRLRALSSRVVASVELAAHFFTSLKTRPWSPLQRFPVQWVSPTITMLGTPAISRDIISMSASAPGVRRVFGDDECTIGVIAFIGKWRFIAFVSFDAFDAAAPS